MISSIWQPSTLPKAGRRGLIYFICGNPGCIGFYADFLEALRGMLDSSETHTAYDIYGRNLRGFSDGEHEPFAPGSGSEPWDVDGQVEAVTADVVARAGGRDREGDEGGEAYDLVILTGHSIGAYIAVEIFDRHLRNPERAPHLRLRHGFLLFPTIASIGLSPSGRHMQLLRRVPTLEALAPVYARLLLGLVPGSALRWLLETVMGFSARAADVAAEWLKGRDGVRQALHMGISELDHVCEDGWDEELWGAATAEDVVLDGKDGGRDALPPRFFLFYGKSDHWVADHVRDEFVRRRMAHGERGGRTSIMVDEGNLPHAFCVTEHNSWVVAKRVHGWLEEIEGGMKN
ncbi:lipid-droplet associated hydrolase [Hirsutella rhossiliensis]|uniref:Lipid-droplet associated hydrolase domain-containing protein n=1 Tax=Hirsutella rhossiliensis TaxID=111463 RepID=A0A9P8N2F6_9HYPO|nr:lipid-droplet associated hydrolase domain-containing protein [Hirsutella rhossiliensis]KAH0964706.1 lipid-droplet associated hydrolase domain-containing protein [Hirsutella rhossiliensis]